MSGLQYRSLLEGVRPTVGALATETTAFGQGAASASVAAALSGSGRPLSGGFLRFLHHRLKLRIGLEEARVEVGRLSNVGQPLALTIRRDQGYTKTEMALG